MYDLLAHYDKGRENLQGVISENGFSVVVAENINATRVLEILRGEVPPGLPGKPDSWELIGKDGPLASMPRSAWNDL